jgi:hypothetical protein
MTRARWMLAAVTAAAATGLAWVEAAAGCGLHPLDEIALQTGAADQEQAARAVARLRAAGPAGLEAMLRVWGDVIGAGAESQARIGAKLDAVAGQKDAWASRLYWHTDLEAAQAAARAAGRPILSLRLLGRLDEEFSCANSRFFRTVLYPDAAVSAHLRERFVLHWQSVRPAPRITIDFGDGRKIQRTITGNSVHYVLRADGRPVEALPGLYDAQTFLTALRRVEAALAAGQPVVEFHRQRLAKLEDERRQFESHRARLDGNSRQAMRAKFPDAQQAGGLAASKMAVEDPFLRMVRNFERTLAEDTARNEFELHRRIHEWFAAGEVGDEVEKLNERVYAELFLMPAEDAWLGLAPADVYSALPAAGGEQTEERR